MATAAHAAADAWLAQLPAAQRAAAHALTDARLVAWMAGVATILIVCWLVSASGLLGRLRRAVEAKEPRPWLASAICAAVLALALAAANAPVSALCNWRVDAARGAGGDIASELARAAATILPSVAEAILIVPPLYWLMRRLPRAWPWLAGGAFLVAVLAAGWGPYALAGGPALPPAPPGPVRDGVAQLMAQSHLPVRQIYASRDPAYDADVMGVVGPAKVVLGPALLAGPPAEARAYVGHLMSHYVHADVFVVCLIYGLFGLAALIAVQRLAAPLAQASGSPEAKSAADPQTMPAAAAVLTAVFIAATLCGNGYLRWANVRADAYSLDHAHAPDGLAAAIERFWDHESVDPNPLEEALFYAHPPLQGRLERAMAWKAAHGGG